MNLPEKWKNLQPNTRALIVVLPLGAIGAVLSCWWNLSIGEKDFASGVANLNWFLRIFLGMFGAAATVFVVARTDKTKLIHCGIIAALAGMAGPYLVIKALSTVVSVNPNLVQIGSAIGIVESATTKLNDTIQTPTAGTNPQKIVDAFDQAAQATTSYLTTLKNAPENEKQRALADTKNQFQETLKVLDTAASIVPKQSVPLIQKLATAAREAGAPAVAEEAQKILDTNTAVQAAAETAENIGKVYFITPGELTDNTLHELQDRIRKRFSLADIQPAVHPTRQIAPGLEIVYYRYLPSDRQNADALGQVVIEYLKDHQVGASSPRIRKYSASQATPPFQFDIHIGPDIAANLLKAGAPLPSPK
jgi:F0F1-type ATP synthase delta subunit